MDDPHRQAVWVNTSLCKRAAISILASLRVYDARPFLDGRGCFCLVARWRSPGMLHALSAGVGGVGGAASQLRVDCSTVDTVYAYDGVCHQEA